MPQSKASAAANEVAVRDAATRVLSSFVSEADHDPDIDPDDVSSIGSDKEVAQAAETAVDGGSQPQAEAPAVAEGSFSCASAPAAIPDANGGGEPDDGGMLFPYLACMFAFRFRCFVPVTLL